jgi:hypothetical protein
MSNDREFDDLVTVARFNFGYQAHLLAGKLEAEGIMAFVHDENNMSITPFISQIHGGVRVEVRQSQEAEARAIIKTLDDAVTPAPELHAALDIEGVTYDLVKGACPECSTASVYLRRPSALANAATIAFLVTVTLPIKLRHDYFCYNCHHEWKG